MCYFVYLSKLKRVFLVPVTIFLVVFRHRVIVSCTNDVAAEKIPKLFWVCGHQAIGDSVLLIENIL